MEIDSESKEKTSEQDRLKLLQLNSWEAELLISALLLYALLSIPDYVQEFRRANFPAGSMASLLLSALINALRILQIGYVVHIITRGVWVANVGLSFVFPQPLDLKKIGFKGRFRKELEHDPELGTLVNRLERIASATYAVSFMLSGILFSGTIIVLIFVIYTQMVMIPAFASANPFYSIPAILGMFAYCAVMLMVFVDFITNGFFRRDAWMSKYYYYIAIVFRYLSGSFIYNRSLATIISILPKWQAHLVPVGVLAILIGYEFATDQFSEYRLDQYYSNTTHTLKKANYETLRTSHDPLIATIQSDEVNSNHLRLFIADLSEFNELNQWDSSFLSNWKNADAQYRTARVDLWLQISIDEKPIDSLKWLNYQHPGTFLHGYLTYIPLGALAGGFHTLSVQFDTLHLVPGQIRLLKKVNPPRLQPARIPFYLSK